MPLTAPTTPPGLPASLDYPEVPAGSILAAGAARWGDRTAFAQDGRSLTFTETYRAACRFANALRERGIGRGDVVALHLPNCLAFPVAYYGTLLAGATFSPTNPLLPPDDLAFQLADCEAVGGRDVRAGRGRAGERRRPDPGEVHRRRRPGGRPARGPGRVRGVPRRAARDASRSRHGHPRRPRAPRLHRRHHRPVEGRAAHPPQRRGQHAPARRAGAPARFPRWTRTARSRSTRSAARRSGRRGSAPASRST